MIIPNPSAENAGLSAVITISTTKSAAINCGGMSLVGFIMPAAFTGTAITFEVSNALAGTYVPLYDSSNNPVSMTVAVSRAYSVNPALFVGWQYLKLVSGSTELAGRTIICNLKG